MADQVIAGRLVRRGVQMVQDHFATVQAGINTLEADDQSYRSAGPDDVWNTLGMIPFVVTGIFALLILSSVSYTIGQRMAAVAMIESSTQTTIVATKPPAYSEQANAPSEKEPLMMENEDADIETSVVEHKPVTSSIITYIKTVQRESGFTGRWRGLHLFVAYNVFHGIFTELLAGLLGLGLTGRMFSYVFVSMVMARLHMAWTHSMIRRSAKTSWYRLLPARRDCTRLLLPTAVFAFAQQVTVLLPIGVAFVVGAGGPDGVHFQQAAQSGCPKTIILTILKVLAVPATYIIVGLAVLFPATVTLTRIEATLLPESEETIVPFDKATIVDGIDVQARGSGRLLFVQAWRSFDRYSRFRLLKVYVRMVVAQIAISFIALHLMIAELYIFGPGLGRVFHSIIAHVQSEATVTDKWHSAS